MLRYYRKLFQMIHRLLQVRAVNLGWLLLMAILTTLHIMMLNAGWVAIKAVLAGLFTLGLPFEVTLIVTVLTGSASLVNQSDEILAQAWRSYRRNWFKLIGFEGLLLLVWLPFGGAGFTATVVNFIGLSGSWADQIVMHRVFWLSVIGLAYLSILGGFTWSSPRLLKQDHASEQQPSIKGLWARLRLFFRPMVALWLPMLIVDELGVFFTHEWVVKMGQTSGRLTSMLILTVFVALTLLMLSAVLVAIIWESLGQPTFNPDFEKGDLLHTMAWFPTGLVVLLIGMFSFQAFHFGVTNPGVVSVAHRGTVNHNGVPNTIQSLKKTVQRHPSYVEIDVQETKDKQFVVLHNDTIAFKSGESKRPIRDFTLAQLQRVKRQDGGATAHLSSLREYLAVARANHQRVMVEIKVNPHDSADMARRFVRQYGRKIVAQQGLVHTMSYKTLTQLKTIDQELIVGYILPVNLFSIRNLPADFYSLQVIGLNQTFVQQAHSMGAPVFVWSPTRISQMQVMRVMGIDGIITDRLDRLEKMERQPPQSYYWAIVQEIVRQFI
ncbi:glycerophosphodiester phosphodiesterase [Secundilactobacillus kimchicus]|uniref:glycerophosphodiester phosphodiesterase n=1 Tax=Secundilactobacillus kimchicus TaxID=528209 RepID=UPI0024A9A49B|nr:glycerophosphodiester phosphodiesterase [Secundilactobacillus kimchicus]